MAYMNLCNLDTAQKISSTTTQGFQFLFIYITDTPITIYTVKEK